MEEENREAVIARHRDLLSGAYRDHWIELDREESTTSYFSYDLVGEIKGWSLPNFGDSMLSSDFNELINAINAWNHRLRSWAAWNRVLENIDDEGDRWEVRSEFVEPLAYFCLHQPAGMKDRLIRFGTLSAHVGNMRVIAGYRDVLDQDAKVFKRLLQGHPKPHSMFLSRGDAEEQLREKSKEWKSAEPLILQVSLLDSENYREATGDWRNRAAHGIPQHFEFGQVEQVTRTVGFATTLVKGLNGVVFEEDRSRTSVSYSFGGVDALSLETLLQVNREQFEIAEQAMKACELLLREVGARAGVRSTAVADSARAED